MKKNTMRDGRDVPSSTNPATASAVREDAQHTPGPWTHESSESLRGDPEAQIPEWCDRVIAGGPADEVIAMSCGPVVRGTQLANARLIAAAPELLAAALAARAYDRAIAARGFAGDVKKVEGLPGAIAEGDDLDELYLDWQTKADAAIAKAEGR